MDGFVFLDREQRFTAHNLSSEVGMHKAYYKHMRFIDFEEFGLKNPIYINMVKST